MSAVPSMFGENPSAETAPIETDYVQPTLGHGLRIWWAFYWRNTIVAAILVAALILAIKPLYLRGAISPEVFRFLMLFGPWVITYAVAVPVFYFILRKRFRDFRIGLVQLRDGLAAEVLPPTLPRTLRIWWTYSWRTVIYRLVLGFVASLPLGILLGTIGSIFPRLAPAVGFLGSSVIEAAVGLFVIYSNILDEDFSDFRVNLIPRTSPEPATASAPAIPPLTT
jgi:purine-cytosine permease-like protein